MDYKLHFKKTNFGWQSKGAVKKCVHKGILGGKDKKKKAKKTYSCRKSSASKELWAAKKPQVSQPTICRQIKNVGYKKVNEPICHQMSAKIVEKTKKTFLGLMLRKGRYKTWIISDEAVFHLTSTTGKTKMQ